MEVTVMCNLPGCDKVLREQDAFMVRPAFKSLQVGAMDVIRFSPTRYFCGVEHMDAYVTGITAAIDGNALRMLSEPSSKPA